MTKADLIKDVAQAVEMSQRRRASLEALEALLAVDGFQRLVSGT